MTFNPNLHVGPARWTRPGRGSPELVYVISLQHHFSCPDEWGNPPPHTWARIRRADDSTKEDVPGTALVNCGREG